MGGLLFISLYIAFLYLSGVVVLSQPLVGLGSMFYFIGGIILLVLLMTFLLHAFRKSLYLRQPPVNLNLVENQWLAYFQPMAFAALFGGIMIMADFAISLRYGRIDFVTLRETFSERQITPFAYLANLFGPFSIFTLGLTIMCYERLTLMKRCFGLVVGTMHQVIGSIGLAGRGGIVEVIIWIVWWLLQRPLLSRPIIPKTPTWRFGFPIAMLGAVFLLGLIAVYRESGYQTRHEAIITFNKNVITPAPWFLDVVEDLSPVMADVITEAVMYWPATVAAFDKIYHDWNLEPAPFSYFFPIIHRRLASWDLSSSSQAMWEHQTHVLLSYGIYPNMFLTTPGTLIMALGKVAGAFSQVLLAVLGCYVFVLGRVRKDLVYLYLSGIFFLYFFSWFQKSLFVYPIYEYSLYIVLAVLILRPRQHRKGMNSNPSGR